MLTEEKNEEMIEKERADKFFNFFEALANAYYDTFGARALIKLAINNGFEKSDILNYFVKGEELYEAVIEEKKNNNEVL